VEDMAWEGRAGMNAILGFLARFTADYGTIRLFLPACLELFSFIRCPQAYDISQTARQDYMIRAINARRMLEMIKKPDGSSFTVRIEGDEYIQENNGTWEVRGDKVSPTDRAPDLTVSIQAFSQLAAGAVSFSEAMYRPDVEAAGNEETLAKVFVRKPILVEDHF